MTKWNSLGENFPHRLSENGMTNSEWMGLTPTHYLANLCKKVGDKKVLLREIARGIPLQQNNLSREGTPVLAGRGVPSPSPWGYPCPGRGAS